ncbi:uracil permease [Schizosaccharomyces octosporus yFS286]|uniref:Uracil permease n=1 Tax=Schizosaccharomyces octosporus (strain yFS286) TaxID=483514 RepID=S9RDQ5_SCHOY|nr:uracil permease [Schizosaccharomyces octosporus yFS286]EPX72204.1 uracil permease [Schizosaccharomyces octosporus yFS286]
MGNMEKITENKVYKKLKDVILLEQKPGLSLKQRMLTNEDLYPVPSSKRLWGYWNYVSFWLAESVNINTWMISATAIEAGLNWWEAWICVWVGYMICGLLIAATGRPGAVYHISFPVLSRCSFGIWGSFWPVLNRSAMACIWFGVHAWIGGECVVLMIRSIWPSFSHIHNTMEKSGTQTYQWVGFFIFWLVSNVAIWFPVHQIRHLFTMKAFIAPPAAVAFLIWALVKAKGAGPVIHEPTRLSTWEHGWTVVNGIVTVLDGFATLAVNSPDFARFATTPNANRWPQIITVPLSFGITSLIGILVSSASKSIYGNAYWDPTELLSAFLNHSNAHGVRAGVFFIAFGLCVAQLGTNVAANSVSAGNDVSALLPTVFNVRRGAYLASIIAICMCPWNLLSSSNNFTTYLSSYSVFMSAFAGIFIADYFIIRKGYIRTSHLYRADDSSCYYFYKGINFRGFVSYICGMLINIVGMAGSTGQKVPAAANTMFNLNYFLGFIVSGLTHILLCYVFPVTEIGEKFLSETPQETEEFLISLEDTTDTSSDYFIDGLPSKEEEKSDIHSLNSKEVGCLP